MNLWFDLKYAWRLFIKTPGHSLLSVVVISLSVGTALWAYVFYYSISLRPLGFPGSDRWYSLEIAADAKAMAWPSLDAFTYQEVIRRNRTVNHLGAFANRAAVLSEGQASTRLRVAAISPRLLAATKARPFVGRLFDEAESQAGATSVVILSFATWKNYFASDPAIVGKLTRIDSHAAQIVGVMPEDFYAFEDNEIWIPLQLPALARPSESSMTLSPFVVIDNGQQLDTALNEIGVVIADINKTYPALFKAERHAELIAGHLWITHVAQSFMKMLLFMGLAVTLLGSMNISMVFLARLLERSRELALRTALGASRTRLLTQCLMETAFVVLLGLIVGYGLTALANRWFQNFVESASRITSGGRWWGTPALKPSDVATAVAIATAVWLLSTLIPARRVAKQDAVIALAGSGKGAVGFSAGRGIRVLVALQVLVSCLVLVLCANMVFATRAELKKPSGLDTTRVIVSTFPTTLDESDGSDGSDTHDRRYAKPSERLRYWEELTAAIKGRVPDAEVAYATSTPTYPASVPVMIDAKEASLNGSSTKSSNSGTFTLPVTAVSEDYFSLLGLKLLSGRLFDSADAGANTLNVAVVDESTARRYWPDQSVLQDVLGKRVQLEPDNNGPWLTIVGVVSHARRLDQTSFGGDRDSGVVYRPLHQATPTSFHVIAKLPTLTADSRSALRAAAFAVDRDLPLHNLQMFDDYRVATEGVFSGIITMLSVIAAITSILAATGLFGLISRSVAQRTQEVGVRRALGATQKQVTAVFLREGALHLAVGVIGVGLGAVITNLIGTGFPNIMDQALPVTLGVLILMFVVIFTASYLPTRRAVSLEPGDALRYE